MSDEVTEQNFASDPVSGDGVITFPRNEEGMKMAMEEVTKVVLEQSFAETHKRSSHASQRFADGSDNIAEQTRLGYLEEKFKVGTREAAAMQRMDTNGIARDILQQRAVMDQPKQA